MSYGGGDNAEYIHASIQYDIDVQSHGLCGNSQTTRPVAVGFMPCGIDYASAICDRRGESHAVTAEHKMGLE
jgi:hypothetical protein